MKNERKVVSRSTSGKGKKKLYSYQSLAPEVKGRHMEALMVTLEENPEGEMSVHDGEEFIYVVDGTVVVKEVMFDMDEGVRFDASLETMASLRPAFKAKGTVTAGNASQTSDGAAALVLMSKERAKKMRTKPGS